MRRTLSMITLAVLTVGLLGSCSKINERLDNLEKKVDGLENEKIASIQTQVEKINSSISDLGAIRSNIQSLTDNAKAQGQDIAALQAADKALDSRIEELSKYVGDTLKAYATEEWVKATFSTLEQYKKTCDTIAKIDARIGALDENLSEKIADCADSLTTWINGQFEGYYTAAEMDAKLALMKSAVDSAKAAGEITDAKADSLAVELAKVQPAIDSAKAQLTREYTAAIDTAIKTLEGNLTKQIQDEIEKVNGTATDLAQRVGILEFQVRDLLGRVGALESRVQSVTIVPAYSDGSLKVENDSLHIDCIITPASATRWLGIRNFTILVKGVAGTKADVETIRIASPWDLKIDWTRGTASIKVKIADRLPGNDSTLTVALNVKDTRNGSDYTTEFVPVYDVPYVVMNMGTGQDAYTLKWRKMNLGATTVAGSLATCAGDFYAWGATELAYSSLSSGVFTFKPDRPYSYGGAGWDSSVGFHDKNTPYYDGTNSKYIKYTGQESEGGEGILKLESGDDAATVNLGNGWRMPTSQEFIDLCNACGNPSAPTALSSTTPDKGIYWLEEDQSNIPYYTGVAGLLFVDEDGNKLFFPAAGNGIEISFSEMGTGYYWSSTTNVNKAPLYLLFTKKRIAKQFQGPRYFGLPIRPVSE